MVGWTDGLIEDLEWVVHGQYNRVEWEWGAESTLRELNALQAM